MTQFNKGENRMNTPYTPPNELPPSQRQSSLKGQKALVTGASKGLGQSIAIGLAQAGADVLINYYSDKTGAEETAHEVEKTGQKAVLCYADTAVEEDVTTMFSSAVNEFGQLDICVPNSGLQLNAPLTEMTMNQWQRVIDVNLTGQFLCARESAKLFLKQGVNKEISYAAGKIIFMSSVHDIIPWEGHVNYAASKGGIMLLMKSIAQELAHKKIRANAVSPGAIRTPMNVEKLTTPEAFDKELLKLMPAGRIGEPEDVSRATVWLASDDSDYINGQTIYIDGGMTLYPGFIGGG
jgi:glucose 1-dehydrogenase